MVESRGSEISGTAGFFLALSWIFVLLRVYCRLAVVKAFGADDYLCVLTQLLFTFYCSFAILGVAYGSGVHAKDIVPQSNIILGLKWWWACEPVYVLSNMMLKFSTGIFLLRIAVFKTQRIILWTVMAVSGVTCTYFFFLFVFQCWPVQFFWAQYEGMKGYCLDTDIIVKSAFVYSGVCCWADWTYSILPAFMVWKLQMNIRTKIGVTILLFLSCLGSIATFIRFPYIAGLSDKSDFLYATTDVAVWSTVETGLGITASAAATLRPLFRDFFNRSRLMGGYSSERTGPWPLSNVQVKGGYERSGSASGNGSNEDYDVERGQDKNWKAITVTTKIVSTSEHQKEGTPASTNQSQDGLVLPEVRQKTSRPDSNWGYGR